MSQTLLIELLTEELPPKALTKLGESFANDIYKTLQRLNFVAPDGNLTWYATPRRLALQITKVQAQSPDEVKTDKLMPVSVALDSEGKPTNALQKKMQALGIPEEKIPSFERRLDGKAEALFYTRTVSGGSLHIVLGGAIVAAIENLPIPKVMNYQRLKGKTLLTEKFVRPAHKLVVLHGEEIMPVSVLGLQAGRTTLGHRFLSEGELTLRHADEYAVVLENNGKVIASVTARKEKIRAALLAAAGADKTLMPESLLDEVNALVEWPVVYACRFEEEFLAVPQECLILTMQTNQKYFALTDANGKLRSRFLIVSNIETMDPSHIIGGNERVVRPRLSDAKFFFEQDQKKTLASRLPSLAGVVYHNMLGSQAERSTRVTTLAGKIAAALGHDVKQAERAAQLSKADLLTDMVGEFPELQGIMGTYYARHDGEPEEVALAISEHYQPRFAGDALPTTNAGTAAALADKLETLVGIWGIGLQPTGDRDPFALRRHALGILRMLIEKRLPLSLEKLLEDARAQFGEHATFVILKGKSDIPDFLYDRLRGLLRERGYAPNEIEAVVAQPPDRLDNIVERLQAVTAFAQLPEAESLAAANKRITNILKKNAEGEIGAVVADRLVEPAEQALFAAMNACRPEIESAYAQGDFTSTLTRLAQLRSGVDQFFDKVMVMAEDQALRDNRIALLSSLHQMMNRVADISKLAA